MLSKVANILTDAFKQRILSPASGFCEYALIHIFHAHTNIQIYNKRFVKMSKWFEWCHENLCKGKF